MKGLTLIRNTVSKVNKNTLRGQLFRANTISIQKRLFGTENLLKTALYDTHLELGGKMVSLNKFKLNFKFL